MFVDLVKAKRPSKKDEELSPERIRELMDELFKGDEDEDEELDKGMSYEMDKGDMDERGDMDEMDEMDKGDMGEMDEDLEKGDEDKRREMMSSVYSLVDDLSDEELKAIIDSRMMKKALVMNVVNTMETGELNELVSQLQANGAAPNSPLNKAEEEGEGEEEVDIEELEKALTVVKSFKRSQDQKKIYGHR